MKFIKLTNPQTMQAIWVNPDKIDVIYGPNNLNYPEIWVRGIQFIISKEDYERLITNA